eukprot:4807713-Pyramimonas_sp.AAC.1
MGTAAEGAGGGLELAAPPPLAPGAQAPPRGTPPAADWARRLRGDRPLRGAAAPWPSPRASGLVRRGRGRGLALKRARESVSPNA